MKTINIDVERFHSDEYKKIRWHIIIALVAFGGLIFAYVTIPLLVEIVIPVEYHYVFDNVYPLITMLNLFAAILFLFVLSFLLYCMRIELKKTFNFGDKLWMMK